MMRPTEVDVEVILPVHDLTRPVDRAVRSVLDSGLAAGQLRVTVVAHNLRSAQIERMLAPEFASALDSALLRVLELRDGSTSPAAPRALGLQMAHARYVSFVDSDDWLEPGALAAWLQLADRRGAAAVIPIERHASGALVRNPPVRVLRLGPLRPGSDRLVYRTALRGLIALDAVDDEHLTFTAGGTNGSDQPFTLKLWHSGRRLEFASRRPAYVLGDDASSRITRTPQPLRVELAAPLEFLDEPWLAALTARDREQAVTKIVRIHLLPQLSARLDGSAPEGETEALETAVDLLEQCEQIAPDYRRSLSRIDAELVELVLSRAATDALRPLLAVRRQFTHPRALLTPRVRDSLRRDAPLRLATASVLLSLRAGRASRRPEPRHHEPA
jgi:hypothetical protein